ncbi:MAG: hypothetical protein NT084_01090 [Bacteroidetes bacterium]|nr:hypothetical protein [Bacteroidota bacterium]
MKKLFCIPVFLMFFCVSSVRADEFEKTHGLGIIQIDLDSLISLDFWEAPDDILPIHIMTAHRELLYPEQAHFTFDRLKQDSIPAWFNTLYFYSGIESRRLDINCLGENGQYFQTNLKSESGKFLWIRKSMGVVFKQWIDFYLSVTNLEYVSDTVLLYDNPTNKVQAFPFFPGPGPASSRIVLAPIEISGIWMKVDIIETNEFGDALRKNSGWILWRNEKEPLVTFNLMGC